LNYQSNYSVDELNKSESTSQLDLPYIAHPACAALQIALVDLFQSWGIIPHSVIGHSSGEIPAAYCAGKLSKQGVWKAAYYRGKVSSGDFPTKGAMVAVGLGVNKLVPYLEQVKRDSQGELIIACFNSPNNCTVSGDAALCDALQILLEENGIFARKLKVPNAYHSAHMRVVADEYLHLMGDLADGEYFDPDHEVTMFSTVSGRRVVKKKLEGHYWVDNLVSPVRFVEGLKTLRNGGAGTEKNGSQAPSPEQSSIDHILELGPHAALQSAIKEILSKYGGDITYLPVLHRNDENHSTLLRTIGTLRSKGSDITIARVNATRSNYKPKMLTTLPPYSFNHSSKVIAESRLSKNFRFRKAPRHDLFGALTADSTSDTLRWRHFIRVDENPWVKQHKVCHFSLLPITILQYLTDCSDNE
jgi:acyl transferase domain-containing protein